MQAELRRQLRRAFKAGDPVALSALRSALAAIENAAAVQPPSARRSAAADGSIAGSVRGLGATDAERRHLTTKEVEGIVRGEVEERLAAADDHDGMGLRQHADRLRQEAAVLARHLPDPGIRSGGSFD